MWGHRHSHRASSRRRRKGPAFRTGRTETSRQRSGVDLGRGLAKGRAPVAVPGNSVGGPDQRDTGGQDLGSRTAAMEG